MCSLSRREMLRFLMIALPAALYGYKGKDYFDEELVCSHVFELAQALPEPLLEKPGKIRPRSLSREYFQIGLPELILCRTEMKLLDMFQYFWPISRSEIQQLQRSITILFKKTAIEKIDNLGDFQKALEKSSDFRQRQKASLAVILTLNDFTKYGGSLLIDICRSKGIDELVIFKDPSKPPYLCSYPSQQKGFKRPPPIGTTRFKTKIAAL